MTISVSLVDFALWCCVLTRTLPLQYFNVGSNLGTEMANMCLKKHETKQKAHYILLKCDPCRFPDWLHSERKVVQNFWPKSNRGPSSAMNWIGKISKLVPGSFSRSPEPFLMITLHGKLGTMIDLKSNFLPKNFIHRWRKFFFLLLRFH